MERYNGDVSFFNIVNQNARQKEAQARKESELRGNFAMIEQAVARSIKEEEWNQKKAKIDEKRRKEYERQKKIAIKTILAAIVLVLGLGMVTKNHIKEEIKTNQSVNIMINDSRDDLRMYGLATLDYSKPEKKLMNEGPYTVKDNTTKDYERLNVRSYDIGRIYSYMYILNDEEFEDFIRSVDPNDGSTYTSFKDYLDRNGFASKSEFVEAAKEAIYKESQAKGGR